eukprot:COSAG05_NODE_11514_length_509_cov_8.356098_2_plen_23_part_01
MLRTQAARSQIEMGQVRAPLDSG